MPSKVPGNVGHSAQPIYSSSESSARQDDPYARAVDRAKNSRQALDVPTITIKPPSTQSERQAALLAAKSPNHEAKVAPAKASSGVVIFMFRLQF